MKYPTGQVLILSASILWGAGVIAEAIQHEAGWGGFLPGVILAFIGVGVISSKVLWTVFIRVNNALWDIEPKPNSSEDDDK